MMWLRSTVPRCLGDSCALASSSAPVSLFRAALCRGSDASGVGTKPTSGAESGAESGGGVTSGRSGSTRITPNGSSSTIPPRRRLQGYTACHGKNPLAVPELGTSPKTAAGARELYDKWAVR